MLGLVYVLWNSFSGQMLPREGKLVLVCIDILAFALFFAFELLLTVRRESGTYDKRFRSARVTYGSPWSCGSIIGLGFAPVAIFHPKRPVAIGL